MRAATSRSHPGRVKVGERVGIPVGARTVAATVIEDRGDLGARGQQVVRLAIGGQGGAAAAEPYEVELPVDWLTAPRRPAPATSHGPGAAPRSRSRAPRRRQR